MQNVNGSWLFSAQDLVALTTCPRAVELRRNGALKVATEESSEETGEAFAHSDDIEESLDDYLAVVGEEHQTRIVDALASNLDPLEVVRLNRDMSKSQARHDTLQAMSEGAHLIEEAYLEDGPWMGWVDVLHRVEGPQGDDWAYAVADAKLTTHERAAAVIQTTHYSLLLRDVLAEELPHISVAPLQLLHLGDRSVSFRVADFTAYVRRLRARLIAAVEDTQTEHPPTRVPACVRCQFRDRCDQLRRERDDLSLVAGIRRSQIARLEKQDVDTMGALAERKRFEDESDASVRLQLQAGAQVATRTGDLDPELAPLGQRWANDGTSEAPIAVHVRDAADGLQALAPPGPTDLYWDIEGNPLYDEQPTRSTDVRWGTEAAVPSGTSRTATPSSLEYLHGLWCAQAGPLQAFGEPVAHKNGGWFVGLWADSYGQERSTFEVLVEGFGAHLEAHPEAHIYHYAHYERSALERLAVRHRMLERATAELLDHPRLIDLYRTVRRGLIVGTESYSLKELEKAYLPPGIRTEDVTKGDDSIVGHIRYLKMREGGLSEDAEQERQQLEDYNAVDCWSTRRLHEWLAALADTPTGASGGIGSSEEDPRGPTGAEQEEAAEGDRELSPTAERWQQLHEDASTLAAQLRTCAVDLGREDGLGSSGVHALADALGIHGRERRVQDADARRRFELDAEGRRRDSQVLDGLNHVEGEQWTAPMQPNKMAPGDRLLLARPGEAPYDLAAETSVTTLDEAQDGELVLSLSDVPAELEDETLWAQLLPASYGELQIQERLHEIAVQVIDWAQSRGSDDIRAALPGGLEDLILQRTVKPVSGVRDAAEVAKRTLADHTGVVVVQGPPGSGKTRTTAELSVRCVEAGLRVGIAANTNTAVTNVVGPPAAEPWEEHFADVALFDAADRLGATRPTVFRVKSGTRAWTHHDHTESNHAGRPRPVYRVGSNLLKSLTKPGWDVRAGLASFWRKVDAIGESGRDVPVDVLIVDEASQVPLHHGFVLAAATRRLVLVGDQAQLTTPLAANHPGDAGSSVLSFMAGEAPVIDDETGVYLDTSWRMHPHLCRRVSELAYRGTLEAAAATAVHRVSVEGLPPTGVHVEHVVHESERSSSSPEEVAVIRRLVDRLLTGRVNVGDGDRDITPEDIIVLAPFNAQRQRLRHALVDDIRVGTVDSFQGQQAAVVIISMTSTSGDVATRGVEFLMDINRLNVALSRAKALAIPVFSAKLLDADPSSIDDLRRVSGFIGAVSGREVRTP